MFIIFGNIWLRILASSLLSCCFCMWCKPRAMNVAQIEIVQVYEPSVCLVYRCVRIRFAIWQKKNRYMLSSVWKRNRNQRRKRNIQMCLDACESVSLFNECGIYFFVNVHSEQIQVMYINIPLHLYSVE